MSALDKRVLRAMVDETRVKLERAQKKVEVLTVRMQQLEQAIAETPEEGKKK